MSITMGSSAATRYAVVAQYSDRHRCAVSCHMARFVTFVSGYNVSNRNIGNPRQRIPAFLQSYQSDFGSAGSIGSVGARGSLGGVSTGGTVASAIAGFGADSNRLLHASYCHAT